MKNLLRIFKFIMLISFLGLVIIHFILKDRIYGVSTLFYAFPLPIIGVIGLFVTILFYKRKPLFYTLSIVLLGMTVYFSTHYFGEAHPESTDKNNSHILFWNVAQSQPLPTDIIIKHIHTYNPDIVGLVEADSVSQNDMEILKTACPKYEFKTLYGTMLIGVKGQIEDVAYKSEANVYRNNYITATINGATKHIILIDVAASPFFNRDIPLGILHDFAQKHPVDVVLGDFNTPYESVHFKEYKSNFKSFHPYSLGMTSTWPLPFPLIEIDQIWLAKSYQPLQLRKICYKNSDHKLLIAEYK